MEDLCCCIPATKHEIPERMPCVEVQENAEVATNVMRLELVYEANSLSGPHFANLVCTGLKCQWVQLCAHSSDVLQAEVTKKTGAKRRKVRCRRFLQPSKRINSSEVHRIPKNSIASES